MVKLKIFVKWLITRMSHGTDWTKRPIPAGFLNLHNPSFLYLLKIMIFPYGNPCQLQFERWWRYFLNKWHYNTEREGLYPLYKEIQRKVKATRSFLFFLALLDGWLTFRDRKHIEKENLKAFFIGTGKERNMDRFDDAMNFKYITITAGIKMYLFPDRCILSASPIQP